MNCLNSQETNCGPLIRDDPRPRPGEALPGPLHDRLDVPLGHALADLPVDEEPAVTVEEATEVEERPADVDVRDIDVPVLMRPQGLLEAPPLLGGLAPAGRELAGGLEHAVDAGGADGDDVGVQHHVGQPPVPFQGVAVMEGHDSGLLPVLQPGGAGDRSVVPVGSPQPSVPAAELAHGDPQPSDQEHQRDPGAAGPVPDETDDRIPGGLGNPRSVQSSPSSFFSLICSSMSSERTSCLRWSFCSRAAIR